MMKKYFRMAVALATALATISTTGCGISSLISDDVSKYTLSRELTKQELIDFYSKSLDYDAVISRNVKVHDTTYEVKPVTGQKENKLKELVGKAQEILSNDEYLNITDEGFEEATKIISPDTFYTIKNTVDNYALTDGKITAVTGALGYYFVDVEFKEKARTLGQFNQRTSLLGIYGIFEEDPVSHVIKINEPKLDQIVTVLNRYYFDNNIVKNATYSDGIFRIEEGVPPEVKSTTEDGSQYTGILTEEQSNLSEFSDAALESDGNSSAETEDTDKEKTDKDKDKTDKDTEKAAKDKKKAANTPREAEAITTENSEVEEVAEEYSEDDAETTDEQEAPASSEEAPASSEDVSEISEGNAVSENGFSALQSDGTVSIVADTRQIQFNVNEINSIVGIYTDSRAIFPNLNDVYIKPELEGDICGYGIYAAGDGGLKLFGLNRDELEGTVTIRFVFKDALDGSGDIIGTNAYITEEHITRGISEAYQNINIPKVLMTSLSETVERGDRLIANYDLPSLMSGTVFTDMGVGVLRGFTDKHTGRTKYMSTIRQVLGRDSEDNSYLLEVENTVIEGAKDVDLYGTYKDKYYMVIEQYGDQFHITDMLRVSREMMDEPAINLDSSIKKSLTALHLAGEVSDTNKKNIGELLSDLYTAGTNRIITAFDQEGNKKQFTINGEEGVEFNRGIVDCFDDDVALLSTDDRDYIVSNLKNLLTRYGNNVSGEYYGNITEWIGGYDDQVEFTTEELIYYPERNKGYRMEVYYLVSNMHDKWVIDERKVLDEEEIEGEALEAAKSRMISE